MGSILHSFATHRTNEDNVQQSSSQMLLQKTPLQLMLQWQDLDSDLKEKLAKEPTQRDGNATQIPVLIPLERLTKPGINLQFFLPRIFEEWMDQQNDLHTISLLQRCISMEHQFSQMTTPKSNVATRTVVSPSTKSGPTQTGDHCERK